MEKVNTPDSSRLTILWLLLSALITWGTIIALLRWIDLGEIVLLLERSNKMGLVLGFILFALINLLKAERLHYVTISKMSLPRYELLGVVCLYNLLTSILPSGLGEFSYPLLLKMRRHATFGSGISAVLVTRLLDLLSVVIAGAIAVLVLNRQRDTSTEWVTLLMALLLFCVLMALLIKYISANVRGLEHFKTIARRFQDAVTPILAAKHFGQLLFLTTSIWFGSYVVCWWVAQSIHILLNGQETILGLSLVLLLSVLPFKGLMGLGTQQAGWVFGLTLVGWAPQSAFEVGVSMHLVLLSYTLLLGGLGWIVLMSRSSPSAA